MDMLYILIIIVIVVVIAVWYISSNIREKSNNSELALNTDEDKILLQWFEENKKPSFNMDLTNQQIIAKLIKRIYDFDVDPNNIIIGNNLEQEYYNVTKKKISTKFSGNEDCILYLRSIIGINYEVLIINSSRNISKFNSSDDLDLSMINDILDSNLEKTAYDHIRKALNIRWKAIMETNNKNIIDRNSDDSFLYLKSNHNIPKLICDNTVKGDRINLLCNDVEFNALIYRLNLE